MKKLMMGIAVIGAAITMMSCGSLAGAAKPVVRADNAVSVVESNVPVPQEIKATVAPGDIRILDPSAFLKKNPWEGNTAIVGNKDVEIKPKDVEVVFPTGITFTETVLDRTDVTTWITNLPAGLVGEIHEAIGGEKGAKSFKIFVSGTPTETKKEPVQVTIPGEFLSTGSSLTITPNENALIDIAEGFIEEITKTDVALTSEWARSSKTIIIDGAVDTELVPRTIKIRLDKAAVPADIKDKTDLSYWITNLPAGLQALADFTEKDAEEINLTIKGVPRQAVNAPIYVMIPGRDLHRILDLNIKENPDLRFEIFGLTVSSVIVGGAVNNEIVPKTFDIDLGAGALLKEIEQGTDLSAWFTNLPKGLKAVVPETLAEQRSTVRVSISGIPTSIIDAPMAIKVPAGIMHAQSFDVTRNDNARFDVGSFESIKGKPQLNAASLNKKGHWDSAFELNNPKIVDLKDFEAVGVIQVSSTKTEDVGADKNYFWSGYEINYSDLMAEAKRLGAHAIINVVIDYKDTVTVTTEKRHAVPGYKLSPEELALNKAEKDRFSIEIGIDGVTTTLVERTRKTERVYTGTALAIKYKDIPQPPPAVKTVNNVQ
jgi:hypothetical protein